MGAPAITTPRTAPRRRPARPAKPDTRSRTKAKPANRTAAKPATRTRPKQRPRGRSGAEVIRFPVNAVGRTAATVGGLADSGVVVGMARSRVWIGVLGVLLGGIVALNVVGLSLSSSESRTASRIDDLIRANSVQQSRLAHRLSNGEISRKASELGLAVPAPDAVHYLDSGRNDAKRAAERLASGEITNAPPAVAATDETALDPVTSTAVDPATATTTTTADPAATAVTTTTDPTLAPVAAP
jgi:hypothetical protein